VTLTREVSRAALSLDDRQAAWPERFGAKGARLAVMRQAGFPVPDAWLFGIDAFDDVFADAHVRAGIAGLRDAAEPGAAHRALTDAVAGVPLRAAVREQMAAALAAWGSLAVRSSSTREDGMRMSGAGQHATVLGVSTSESLRVACGEVLASQLSPHALRYWGEAPADGNTMAIVVQRMLAPDVSGVIFSRDPVLGREDVLVVEACRGLGAAVVSGEGVEERTVLRRRSYEPLSREVAGGEPVLSDGDLVALVETTCAIEDLLGFPVDVEWSLEGGHLHVLQARPITTGTAAR